MNSTKCSIITRCKKYNIINLEDCFLCLSCKKCWKLDNINLIKQYKNVKYCCDNRKVNYKTNLPFCKNCFRFITF